MTRSRRIFALAAAAALVVALAAALVVVFISARTFYRTNINVPYGTFMFAWERASLERVRIVLADGTAISAEVANTSEERRVGLSSRSSLRADAGMLFLFDEPVRPSFWMKDMDFPIDIIWISGETVIGITADVPVPMPGIGTDELPVYGSETPIDRVLELNAGFVAAHGLAVGDRLDIDLP